MPRKPPNDGRIKKGDPPRNKRGSSTKVRVRKACKELIPKLALTMTPEAIAGILSPLMLGTVDSAQSACDDEQSFARAYAARLAWHGFQNNDLVIFKTFIEMVIGKPKERTSMELTGKDGKDLPVPTSSELYSVALAMRSKVDELGTD